MTGYEATDSPLYLSNGDVIVRGDITREEAARRFESEMEEGCMVPPEALQTDRIRYGYPPEDVDWDGDGACWYTGASGPGSKPVWLLSREQRRKAEAGD